MEPSSMVQLHDRSTTSPSQRETRHSASYRKRSISGGGLLSKLSLIRSSSSDQPRPRLRHDAGDRENELPPDSTTGFSPASSHAHEFRPLPLPYHHQKTRRRRGSLRKAALLGRGAQRREREETYLGLATGFANDSVVDGPPARAISYGLKNGDAGAFGLGISNMMPRPSMDGQASRVAKATPAATQPSINSTDGSYNSTTDDEDALHMSGRRPALLPGSGAIQSSMHRRRSAPKATTANGLRAKSPLALDSLAAAQFSPPRHGHHDVVVVAASAAVTGPAPGEWDYTETEFWGWVVLLATWIVFVTGMGSCLGVWSWAWDVGTTPSAPPELSDDHTLPIVGYYPALIILTGVMAWVWVVVAWVGMKYFRHARVSEADR